jgi:transcriptional regulator of acetoin/glycerol metabolism
VARECARVGEEISAAEVLRFLKHQQAAGPVFSEPLSIEELEKRAIEQALQAVGGNISLAARLLKISRNTLYNKLKKYHIRAG